MQSRETSEFLLLCAPALLIGLLLRIALTAQLPFAYFHDDTSDFLVTADRLLNDSSLQIHGKKTFLVPVVYTVPFLVRAPALIVVPIFQHLLGLGLVLLVGLLCRLWFQKWRVFIIPLTVLAALNPFYLWYEHTLMAETIFVFATVLVAVAGTLYALEQSRARFGFFLSALVLEAGARPEGKLFFGFAILLVVFLHWRRWRSDWPRFAIVVLLAGIIHLITPSSQAGLLLYTSLARLTPGELKSAPGFEPYIAPMRAELERLWRESYSYPRVRHRKEISTTVERYLREVQNEKGGLRRKVNALCTRMAAEIAGRNFFLMPIYAAQKFHLMAVGTPAGVFDNQLLLDKQRGAYAEGQEQALRLSRGLSGETWDTEADIHQFIDSHYREVPWFNRLQRIWLATVNSVRLRDSRFPDPETPGAIRVVKGLPIYFLVATFGLLAAALRRGALQPFHIAWALGLAAFFFVVILTANLRPRFRFVFEPFWFLYIGLLLEVLWLKFAGPRRLDR